MALLLGSDFFLGFSAHFKIRESYSYCFCLKNAAVGVRSFFQGPVMKNPLTHPDKTQSMLLSRFIGSCSFRPHLYNTPFFGAASLRRWFTLTTKPSSMNALTSQRVSLAPFHSCSSAHINIFFSFGCEQFASLHWRTLKPKIFFCLSPQTKTYSSQYDI